MKPRARLRTVPPSRPNQLRLELLEDRTLPAMMFWNVDASGFWDVASNWRDDAGMTRLPGPADDVVIDRPGAFTITHRTGSTAVRSLTSQEAFSLSGGTLSLTTASALHAAFTFSGGTLTGGGSLAWNGPVAWSGGVVSVAAVSSSTMSITGQVELRGGRELQNAGTVTLTGPSGILRVNDPGTIFHNLSGGSVNTTGNAEVDATEAGGVFQNAGLLRVQSGTFAQRVRGVSTGEVRVDAGAIWSLHNACDLLPGATVPGAGLVRMLGTTAHVLTIATPVTIQNLELASGVLRPTKQLNVMGQFTWSSGTLDGAGTTTIDSGATLRIEGESRVKRLLAGHTLDNAGTIVFRGDRLNLDLRGLLLNQLGGIVRADVTTELRFLPSELGGEFHNAGRVEAQRGTFLVGPRAGFSSGTYHAAAGARILLPTAHTFLDATTFSGPGVKVVGNPTTLLGTITGENVQLAGTVSGTHVLEGSFAWLSGTLAGPGETTLAAGSTLTLDGAREPLTLDSGRTLLNQGTITLSMNDAVLFSPGKASFANAGTVQVSAATLTLVGLPYTQTEGSTLLIEGGLRAPLVDVQGGILSGTGSILGDVQNAGELQVGGAGMAGSLTVFGNYTQTTAGSLSIELGGLTQGGEYDSLAVTGTATLDGLLRVALINGFVPNADDLFTFLAFASLKGDFTSFTGLEVGTDRALAAFFDGAAYYLVVYLL